MIRHSPRPWPRLLLGSRRALFAALLLVGVVAAALAVVAAIGVGQVLGAAGAPEASAVIGLGLAFAGIAAARYAERVLGEKLGQSFVMDLREQLVRATLRPDRAGSLGVLMTRTSNDLAAVRMWIAQGITPLLTAAPLVLGAVAYLSALDPRLGGTVAGMLLPVGIGVLLLARSVLARARSVRRARGRLAALVADAARAAPSLAASGGIAREVGRVGRAGRTVVAASVRRASAVGAMRALVLFAASATTLIVVVVGTGLSLPLTTLGSALTLTGLLATPLADLGRSVEYRQNFLAARRMIEPALDRGGSSERSAASTRTDAARGGRIEGDGVVEVAIGGRTEQWTPGTLVHLAPHESDELLDGIVAAASGAGEPDAVRVGGVAIASLSERRRRRTVGVARSSWLLERGPLSRAVAYRHPGTTEDSAAALLRRLAFDPADLRDGMTTRIREGGAPLSAEHRTITLLARAMLGEPALLVIDGLVDDLPEAAASAALRAVSSYPGVVVLRSRRSPRELQGALGSTRG